MKEMYEWWFAGIRSLSTRKKYLLREEMKDAEAIFNIEEIKLERLSFLTKKDCKILLDAVRDKVWMEDYRVFKEKEILFVPYFDKQYPGRLKKIASPPYALYVKGNLPKEDALSVAIVGARQCTAYGEEMARVFGEELSGAGIQIISGMAKGIDGAGQRGALNAGGVSYAVLGCGVDICYPADHRGLYTDLQEKGGILSEQPTGIPPLREFFPARNRIISGLSDVVLVMEARERSGSLITADMALEQGKDVYALPGPVTSPLSKGCNWLIKQGAGILISPDELLKDLKMEYESRDLNILANADENEKVLESTENLLYSKLDLFPKSLSCLLSETGLSPDVAMQQLVSLIMKGLVKEVSRNYYIKAKV